MLVNKNVDLNQLTHICAEYSAMKDLIHFEIEDYPKNMTWRLHNYH
jgi:hypothetical protein